MPEFVENLIQSELGGIIGLDRDKSLGLERAHRVLGPQLPADNGGLVSIVLCQNPENP